MSEGTALLVIDMQVGLVAGAYRAGEVLGTIATLLAKARSSGTTVVYLQHESDEFEPLKRGTPTWQIHPEIVPAEGELVIPKRASDSFYQTSLRGELEARRVRHLVVTGMMTEACVDTTSRAAISLGYDVTLVEDAAHHLERAATGAANHRASQRHIGGPRTSRPHHQGETG